jgi:hypothetical protein
MTMGWKKKDMMEEKKREFILKLFLERRIVFAKHSTQNIGNFT